MVKFKAITATSLALMLAGVAGAASAADDLRVRLDLGANYNWAQSNTIDAALGFAQRYSANAGVRFMLKGGEGAWRYQVHWQLTFDVGDNVGFDRALAGMFASPPPPSLFDLNGVVYGDANTKISNNIDRLSLSYTSDNFVVRIGRQALTWGAGLVFKPGDIIAPFAPNAVERTYKPGVDMLYGQYLFDNGADLEAVFVPRRKVAGGAFDWSSSTLALHSNILLGDLDGAIMLARDRGDTVLNLSLGGPLGGMVWNAQVGQWLLSDGSYPTTFVANISGLGTFAGKNITYFAEYFHNGFGVAPNTPLDALPMSLSTRLSTGQLFNAGRNFVALGGQINLTPDIIFSPSVIVSLDDASVFGALQARWSLSDDADLIFSASKGFGNPGSEFGGRETSAGSGIYLAPAGAASVGFTRYF
ncbi:hypothetical protein MNBD_ALPHA12-1442 [hydrothermal vent metagenome]|uniref:Uncharacterized protein n=1 Tax=hydrothermal vent metagenome TaxID=652676 RepID=A0A3B0UV26_9ZZZZ